MERLRNLGFLIKDISRVYTKLYEERAGHLDVTLAQCKALVYIGKNQGISQIRLAELTGIEPMSLVRILDRMEADEWIERRAHPSDRRARQLYLKRKAEPTLRQIWEVGDAVREQLLSGFSTAERDLLIDLLERARGNLLAVGADEINAAKVGAKTQDRTRQPVTKLRSRLKRGATAKKSSGAVAKVSAAPIKKLLRSVR